MQPVRLVVIATLLCGLSSLTAGAAPPDNSGLQLSGGFSTYYQYQFSNPKDHNLLSGRIFDIRHNTPTLELGELNFNRPAAPGKIGFGGTLLMGEETDILHHSLGFDTGGGESRFKNLGQLYADYFCPCGAELRLGKFFSPFGYERIESWNNYNLSQSAYSEYLPRYHFGLGADKIPLHVPGLTGNSYIVNSIYPTGTSGVQEDNGRKDWIGGLKYEPEGSKWRLGANLGLGYDKVEDAPGNSKVFVGEVHGWYPGRDGATFGASFTYGDIRPEGYTQKDQRTGYGLYYNHPCASDERASLALRYSSLDEKSTGAATRTTSDLTFTYNFKYQADLTLRAELRHDWSNTPRYTDGSGMVGAKKSQDTLSLGAYHLFK